MLKGFVSGEEKDIKRITMGTRNLFDPNFTRYQMGKGPDNRISYYSGGAMFYIKALPNTEYAIKIHNTDSTFVRLYLSNNPIVENTYQSYDVISESETTINPEVTISNTDYAYLWIQVGGTWYTEHGGGSIMLNAGSTPLPYEPYGYQEGWEVRDNQDAILWGREDELQTATGTLPFKGYTLPVKVKSLLGNAVQNGTPSPQNIIAPEMCGVRTGNLWNYTIEQGGWDATSGTIPTKYASDDPKFTIRCRVPDIIPIPSNTMSLTCQSDIRINFVWINVNGVSLGGSGWQQSGSTVTAPENATSTTFILGKVDDSTCSPNDFQNIMLNSGSTALPYEPYGWKVPFENHGENLVDAAIVQSGYYGGTNPGHDIFVSDNKYRAFQMQLNAGTYTLLIGAEESIRLLRVSNDIDGVVTVNTDDAPYAFTLSQDTNIYVSFRNQDTTDSFTNLKIMLTLGSTPKPYSPYLNATLPVYLGEVPTVRRIKKVVFTGQETWTEVYPGEPEAQGIVMYATSLSEIGTDRNDFRCSHFFVGNYRGYLISGQGRINGESTSAVPEAFNVNYNNGSDGLQNFKAWLASEYAAGHPVTLWYALATEQTSVVNEPLCKISTYADELTTIQVHGLSAPLYGIGDYKDTLNLLTGVVTRKVKKLVLDGTENSLHLYTNSAGKIGFYIEKLDMLSNSRTNGFCTHFVPVQSISWEAGNKVCFGANNAIIYFIFSDAMATQYNITDLPSIKTYLQAQYAAGTPVTIWYVLSTPTTETVTVPTGMTGEIEGYLTQVSTPSPTKRSVPKWNGVEETGGTYAVTVYTPPKIPTTTGQNTLTVDSNLAPSNLEVSIHAKKIHYGFKIDKSNDDSDSAVIYTHDAVTMTPAHMDFTNDRFDYGSWGNAFFVRDCYPVALNLDGSIAYRLDPDDYTKKTDGTASDIFYELLTAAPSNWSTQWKRYYTKSGNEYILNDQASAPTFAQDTYYKLTYNSSFAGNFMMAFPKVWFYRHEDSQYNYIEISNYKLSDDWKCYAHINASGQEVDFIYLPLFKGVIVNSKLRSLPGQIPQGNTTATDEVNAATALGSRWQIWDHSSVECVNDLLTLMSKSIDSQGRFGKGRESGYNSTDTVTYGKLQTGTLIKGGKFHGFSSSYKEVKVFGIEGFWANRWDRLQGMLLVNNVWKIKMTPPYNFTGTDFVTLSNASVPTGNGYPSKVQTSEYGSIPASIDGGSSTKYFKDYFYKTATDTRVAIRGGTCNSGARCGFRYVAVDAAASYSVWSLGASPLYK